MRYKTVRKTTTACCFLGFIMQISCVSPKIKDFSGEHDIKWLP